MSKYAGSLYKFVSEWQRIGADSVIIDWLLGYKIPFLRKPLQEHEPTETNWSAVERSSITDSLSHLINIAAVSKCAPCRQQFVSKNFLVPQPDGTNRLILNLKQLNHFVLLKHFKMENRSTVVKLLSPECFLNSIDLKDAYLLVPIWKDHQKFLRFKFLGELYEYSCLPFGLCTVPFVFCELLKSVIAKLRGLGFKSVIYLDDFLLLGSTYAECSKNVSYTLTILRSLGFLINVQKSVDSK